MAIVKNNAMLQGLSGKIGNIIYRTRNGKTYASLYQNSPKVNTPAAVKHRQKFTLMLQFLNPIRAFINEVNHLAVEKTGFNKIFSVNMKQTVLVDLPELKIDFGKVALSDGTLPNAKVMSVASPSPEKLVFKWTGKNPHFMAGADDVVFMACYCEELKSWRCETNIGIRKNKTGTVMMEYYSGKSVHVYCGFSSAFYKQSSSAMYLGVVNIQ